MVTKNVRSFLPPLPKTSPGRVDLKKHVELQRRLGRRELLSSGFFEKVKRIPPGSLT